MKQFLAGFVSCLAGISLGYILIDQVAMNASNEAFKQCTTGGKFIEVKYPYLPHYFRCDK